MEQGASSSPRMVDNWSETWRNGGNSCYIAVYTTVYCARACVHVSWKWERPAALYREIPQTISIENETLKEQFSHDCLGNPSWRILHRHVILTGWNYSRVQSVRPFIVTLVIINRNQADDFQPSEISELFSLSVLLLNRIHACYHKLFSNIADILLQFTALHNTVSQLFS